MQRKGSRSATASFFATTPTTRHSRESIDAVLVHDICSALESQGLDPQVGYLHRDRPGRPSLALEMMEEFRAVLADRLALTLVNRGQLRPRDFRRLDRAR